MLSITSAQSIPAFQFVHNYYPSQPPEEHQSELECELCSQPMSGTAIPTSYMVIQQWFGIITHLICSTSHMIHHTC